MICAWGTDGACAQAYGSKGDPVSVPCVSPETVVDTLGAGDTFVAAVIAALLRDTPLLEALQYGCSVAGHKCGMMGLETLEATTLDI